MDALKQQLLKIQQQLAGLSASQKMLTASLLVIMVMTLFYWSHFAGTSEMVAVIDSALSAEELANVKSAISKRGVAFEVRDNRVLVPVGKHAEVQAAMADLGFDNKLPQAYDKTADAAENAFTFGEGEAARESRLQGKRAQRVESMIRQWPGVKSASIIIVGERRSGVLNDERPTATVAIMTDVAAANLRKLAEAARAQVTRAQPGLRTEEVAITVNGQPFDAQNPDDPFGGDYLAARSTNEKHFVQTIINTLKIPGLQAAVFVDVDLKKTTTSEHSVDPKAKVEALQKSVTTSEENPLPPAGGEGGAVPNVGVITDAPPAAARSSTSEKTEITNQVDTGFKNTTTASPGGSILPKSAAVRIPESYFRQMWKSRNPKSAADATEADVQQLVSRETPSIREVVKKAIGITDNDLVTVSSFYDFDPTPAAEVNAAAGLATLPVGTGFGAKEMAVGALAVISLFMVSMMVRKSAPQPILAAAKGGIDDAAADATIGGLLSISELAGEVGEANLTLTGQELSEEAIEAKQVIEQVGTMVKDNPDVAANLIKRWLNHA